MINYLTELSIVHLTLTLAYWFFLRNERQYAAMRFYLIASVVLALAIPLFKLPAIFSTERTTDVIPAEVISINSTYVHPTGDASTWNIELLIYGYVAISLFFLGKFCYNLFCLVYLRRLSTYERSEGLYIHRVMNGKTSFSFFNWIFLGEEVDKDDQVYGVMLEHEKAHARLGHTYDIIFFQLFKASFWWLPSSWFVNREIKKIHEYEADAYVLRSYDADEYSSILISSTLKQNGFGLVSSFNDSLILKRLKAMKQETKNVSFWKLGALSALCAVLFTVLACTEEKSDVAKSNKSNNDIFMIVERMPEIDGGIEVFNSHIKTSINYPSDALQKRIAGRVDVQFVVEKDGSLSDVKVINGIGAGCDDEALKAIQSMPRFKPATQNGKPVKVRMAVPIAFNIDGSKGSVSPMAIQQIYNKFTVKANYDQGEWSGVVYDEEGGELPGVNIIVTGTTSGTVSQEDGSFKLKADKSNNVALSFVGYESVELKGSDVSR